MTHVVRVVALLLMLLNNVVAVAVAVVIRIRGSMLR